MFSLIGSFKSTVLSISLLKLLVLGFTYFLKCAYTDSNLLCTIHLHHLGKGVELAFSDLHFITYDR